MHESAIMYKNVVLVSGFHIIHVFMVLYSFYGRQKTAPNGIFKYLTLLKRIAQFV